MWSQNQGRSPFNSSSEVLKYLLEPIDPIKPASFEPETRAQNVPTFIHGSTKNPTVENRSNAEQILQPSPINYGPIKWKRRAKPSKTLATGRRSKDEVLPLQEELERQARRLKNRAAAKKCREKRNKIERELERQIEHENQRYKNLLATVEMLEKEKIALQNHLFRSNREFDQATQNFHETTNECSTIIKHDQPFPIEVTLSSSEELPDLNFSGCSQCCDTNYCDDNRPNEEIENSESILEFLEKDFGVCNYLDIS